MQGRYWYAPKKGSLLHNFLKLRPPVEYVENVPQNFQAGFIGTCLKVVFSYTIPVKLGLYFIPYIQQIAGVLVTDSNEFSEFTEKKTWRGATTGVYSRDSKEEKQVEESPCDFSPQASEISSLSQRLTNSRKYLWKTVLSSQPIIIVEPTATNPLFCPLPQAAFPGFQTNQDWAKLFIYVHLKTHKGYKGPPKDLPRNMQWKIVWLVRTIPNQLRPFAGHWVGKNVHPCSFMGLKKIRPNRTRGFWVDLGHVSLPPGGI